MNERIDVRLLLGGKTTGFIGKYPGLVEEAHFALSAGKPVYLLGGFGGCTDAIIRALLGKKPAALTLAFHQDRDERYAKMLENYSFDPDPPVNYEKILMDLERIGNTPELQGLGNGLGETENRRLFDTDDVDEMITLVLKGLMRLATG